MCVPAGPTTSLRYHSTMRVRAKLSVIVALLCVLAACKNSEQPSPTPSGETPHRPAPPSSNFDYYLLALSWAPEFCATHARNASSSECDPAHHFGFVVHGLWPQNEDGTYPENCAPARPVAEATVRQVLGIIPARGLIQHEWATHGTCSGLAAQEYFADIEKVYGGLQVPADYRAPAQAIRASPAEMEQSFAGANHTDASAFRITCSGGNFTELHVCLTKDLQYRACPASLRDCRTRQVTILPLP